MKKVVALIIIFALVITSAVIMAASDRKASGTHDQEIPNTPIPTIPPPGRYDPPCTAPGKFCILIR